MARDNLQSCDERPGETLINNARIVTGNESFHGSVHIVDGLIGDVTKSRSSSGSAIDFEGDYLIPGFVDVHTDHMEKQIMPRPEVMWDPTAAAVSHDAVIAAAGITTVFNSLTVGSIDNPKRRRALPLMIEGIRAARNLKLLRADHILHLRCNMQEPELLDLMSPFWSDAELRFVTLVDDGPLWDAENFRFLERRKGIDDDAIEARIEAARSADTHCTVTNRQRISELCHSHNIAVGSHDDISEAHVAKAQRLGIKISEFPIRIESARAARDAGMVTISGAPNIVLGRSHVGNVSVRQLVAERLLDIICSDYIPGSLLRGLWILAAQPDGPSLAEAVAMGSRNPAELFGFSDRGEIAVGRRADMVRVVERDGVPFVRNVWMRGALAL